MTPAPPRADAGFTLVEALVSLFVFALIAAGATAMLVQSSESQRQSARAHEEVRSLQIAQALIQADFAQMVLRSGRGAQDGRVAAFVATAQPLRIRLVRAAGDAGRAAGVPTRLMAVEYSATDAGLQRRVSADVEGTDGAFGEAQTLLPGSQSLAVAFFDGAVWRESWSLAEGGALPKAVRFSGVTQRYGPVEIKAFVGSGS